MTSTRAARARRPLLVRQRDLGAYDDPGPRPPLTFGGLLRWGRPLLLPLSSVARADTTDRVVALTYDDGPEVPHTDELVAELAVRDVRATFFMLAEAAERHPELVRDMLRAGHEVGLHGVDHARLTDRPAWRAAQAIRDGKRRLEAVAQRPVTMYRPTYGAHGIAQLAAARSLGMDVVLWTAWARDWVDDTADVVARRALTSRHPGAVLLLHDATNDTEHVPTFSRRAVLATLLDGLALDGYQVVPVGELLDRYREVRAVAVRRPRLPGLRRPQAQRPTGASGEV